MKVDIRQITAEPRVFHLKESAEELDIAVEGAKFPYSIEADFTGTMSGDEIICQVDIRTEAEVECSRCLELFNLPIESRLQYVVQMLDPVPETTDDDDDFEIIPKAQAELDISQRVRESIILAIPIKPLCSDDCKGLCPMCGANLNEGLCGCVPDKSDERWDVLKKLFDNQID
ncbi:MAG: DUF177 domain-containing protein [candidate division Zixibacteria bacterium]|jgi:uncharacterized protein|nr:DUF177 domain-containing protein [candidate division Zixibacteria bacterium]